ncbi:MAG: helix-turn-helix domain-containing protein [Verrucomicrobiae bacterium]|nr:helix-turn-helix domain-containing protein [Verrucomicrobiae bacterium]
MKGKRDSTEEKIRILREADHEKSLMEMCRERRISETTLPRWKQSFGQMDSFRSTTSSAL